MAREVMTIGILRVKNESRWIKRCIASIAPCCEKIVVLDDHSDDGTPFMAAGIPKVQVFDSPFSGLDEARDKNYLLEKALSHNPNWLLCIDGDEALSATPAPSAAELITTLTRTVKSDVQCFALPVHFLWDSENLRRTDGVYGRFWRDSLFRAGAHRFEPTVNGGSFHCGNAPRSVRSGSVRLDAPLLHYGYLHKEDRLRKYEWYNRMDPNNLAEDQYRHMVIGDLFPPGSRFKHGGPLRVERAL